MKLNIANPITGLQRTIEIDDEKRLLPFFGKHMGAEVAGDTLGDEFKGYIFKITGGNDKQGFPMMQGVLTNNRVRLLFTKGMKCYRPRRTGERKRKSVRGCIVGLDLSVINLVLARKGENDIPGLTDGQVPRRLGPKRANKIRKMFNLSKDDDVRKYVARRQLEGKKQNKAPKIQRLITSSRLQRKRRIHREKQQQALRSVTARREYKALIASLRPSPQSQPKSKSQNTKSQVEKSTASA